VNKTIFVFSLFSGLVLSGCVSKSATEGAMEYINSSAQYCADTVKSQSVSVAGTSTLTSLPLNIQQKSIKVTLGTGISEVREHKLNSMAYVTSTALDHGEPGSAWFKCMSLKGINFS